MQELFVTLAPYLAAGIPAVLFVRWLIRERREMRELEQQARCGPGCVCNGERLRERPQTPVIIQTQQPMMYQQPQAQPQIIVIQQPAPQPVYQPQPQVIYLPAPTYQPQQVNGQNVQQPIRGDAPQSYYPGPEPDYPQEVYYLPPSQPIGQLPPARASDISEARRRFEIEREEMQRR